MIEQTKSKLANIEDVQIIEKLKNSEDFILWLPAINQRQLIELLIKKVKVNVNRIKISYSD